MIDLFICFEMDISIDPKYNDVRADVVQWVAKSEINAPLLDSISKKLLVFFPTVADFINNFGLINNFVLMVFCSYGILMVSLFIILKGLKHDERMAWADIEVKTLKKLPDHLRERQKAHNRIQAKVNLYTLRIKDRMFPVKKKRDLDTRASSEYLLDYTARGLSLEDDVAGAKDNKSVVSVKSTKTMTAYEKAFTKKDRSMKDENGLKYVK